MNINYTDVSLIVYIEAKMHIVKYIYYIVLFFMFLYVINAILINY